ncbi:MAG: DNA-3-methyladenine glycosylase, partial [Cyclobacteriaceae bacterium]
MAIAARAIVKIDRMVFIMLLGLLLMFQTSEYEIIPLSFYQRSDVVQISKELVGLYLFHQSIDGLVVGRIVETEAYNGRTDRACHAFHKRTNRTEVMYEMGGRAYVYLCYGIHNLFNVVTNEEGMADAVLIKALEPVEGMDIMRTRTNKKTTEARLASGPGLVGKAMAFNTNQTGELLNDKIWVGRKLVDARR